MFCPGCKEEYKEGFTLCADCDIKLVAKLPAETTPETDSESTQNNLIPVFETQNQNDILIIKTSFEAEGIMYHFSGKNFHMMGVLPTPARLLVASNRRDEALAILRELDL